MGASLWAASEYDRCSFAAPLTSTTCVGAMSSPASEGRLANLGRRYRWSSKDALNYRRPYRFKNTATKSQRIG
jgi:hypothetical protein